MKIKFLFLFLILTNTIQSFAGGPYKIKKMYPPGKKVLIGGKYLKEKDIFYSNQIIRWDKTLKNQAIIAYDIKKPSTIIYFTKLRAKNKDVEVSSYIASLMGKGSNDTPILWSGERISVPIIVDSTYQYKIRISDSMEYKMLEIENNQIFIDYDLFVNNEGLVKYEIMRIKESVFEIIYYGEIEILN